MYTDADAATPLGDLRWVQYTLKHTHTPVASTAGDERYPTAILDIIVLFWCFTYFFFFLLLSDNQRCVSIAVWFPYEYVCVYVCVCAEFCVDITLWLVLFDIIILFITIIIFQRNQWKYRWRRRIKWNTRTKQRRKLTNRRWSTLKYNTITHTGTR